jgi:8-oxo-dGTP diphosphatase
MEQVTAAAIFKGDRILIAKRKAGIRLANKWEFPGGKLEPDETMVQCLKRELAEEFGIEVEIDNFICASTYNYSHGAIELFAYKVHLVSGEFQLRDHDEIKWVLPSELPEYEFAEANIPICERLMEE